MVYRFVLRIFLVICFIFLSVSSIAQDNDTEPTTDIEWSYALVEPVSEEVEPYLIGLPDFRNPVLLVFPEQADITLFTPPAIQLKAASMRIAPHVLSGGYFTAIGGSSSSTTNPFGSIFPLLTQRGRALISGLSELESMQVSNPLTIFDRQGVIVSALTYNSVTGTAYNVCSGASIVGGVVGFDFNSGNAANSAKPNFQILSLDDAPIKFSMPTLSINNPDTFIATTNTRGPGSLRLSIELYDPRFLGPDDYEELYKFVSWERISSLTDYARIQRAHITNIGGGFRAIGATNVVTYPKDTILIVDTRQPACQNKFQIGQRVTLHQRGAFGVREYSLSSIENWTSQDPLPGAPGFLFTDMPSTQALSNRGQANVRITEILDNGFICYTEDDGTRRNDPESTAEPTPEDQEVSCIEAWRVDVD